MRRGDSGHGPLLERGQSDAVAAAVRSLRQERGLTQGDVAAAAGLSQRAISELERLRYRWRQGDAERAAALLGTDLAGLLGAGGASARPPAALTREEAARVAPRIAHLRRRLGWRQRDLAGKAGIAQSTVSAAEAGNGKLGRGALASVAAALGVTAAYLLGDCPRCAGSPPGGFRCTSCGTEGERL